VVSWGTAHGNRNILFNTEYSDMARMVKTGWINITSAGIGLRLTRKPYLRIVTFCWNPKRAGSNVFNYYCFKR
jgi:hypothetical protein